MNSTCARSCSFADVTLSVSEIPSVSATTWSLDPFSACSRGSPPGARSPACSGACARVDDTGRRIGRAVLAQADEERQIVPHRFKHALADPTLRLLKARRPRRGLVGISRHGAPVRTSAPR